MSHFAEEIWQQFGYKGTLATQKWPQAKAEFCTEDEDHHRSAG